MIYVLSGIAKAGKTLISKEIRRNFDISVFSTDYIMMMLHKGNKDLGIDVYASDSSVAKKIEPYVYGMIETMIQYDASYLIEGVHFNTDFGLRLQNEFGNRIKIVYLGYKDVSVEDKVTEIYKYKQEMDNPWIFSRQGETVEDIVTYLISESKRVYQECKECDLNYIDVYDINKQKKDIINEILK